MIKAIKRIIRPLTPLELATRELDEAKRELLAAQSGLDYAKRIVEYHKDRVTRLTGYVSAETKDDNERGKA